MTKTHLLSIAQAVAALHHQDVIAYPTEAVFGLGCDPDSEIAIAKLLALKQRRADKGLILVAANYAQLAPYVDESQIPPSQRARILASWPGPVTWIMPKYPSILPVLSGAFDTIAVRVSAHSVVQALCRAFGKPIVSTSANLSGYPPCLTADEVAEQFGHNIEIVEGDIGACGNPTEIRHSLTNEIMRKG